MDAPDRLITSLRARIAELEAANVELREDIGKALPAFTKERDLLRAEVERLTGELEDSVKMERCCIDDRDALRARLDLFMPLYEELKGRKWVRQDGQENKLAVAMANLERGL